MTIPTTTSPTATERLVPEGAVPNGLRPSPGPRPARDVWAGSSPDTAPEAPSIFARARLTGLDAARGVALFGMIAVHTLPTENTVTGTPTTAFALFGGRAAALFAVLAGLSLALVSGRQHPHRGGRWWRTSATILIRAMLIFLLGIGLNHLDLPVYNILPYYGLLFLLAIPFTRLGPVWNFLCAGLVVIVGPVAIHLITAGTDLPVVSLPTFSDLGTTPAATITSLLATGTFPAVSWLAFVLVGIGLGRLPLSRTRTQAGILVAGGVLAIAGPMISGLILNNANRWSFLVDESTGMSLRDAIAIDTFGPPDDQPLPVGTWWWLAVDGPHTNTPLALLGGIGTALLAIAVALLIGRAAESILTPLIATGSMTLTLYTAHLVFMSLIDTSAHSGLWLAVQLIVAALFGTVWLAAFGRGPLERIVHLLASFPRGKDAELPEPRRRRRRRRKTGNHSVV